jgi:hypothetical protein
MAGTRNWSEAIERAKKHTVGQFSNTHGSTLKSLAEAGLAEKLSDGLYYLTDGGWGEDKPAEEPRVEQGRAAEPVPTREEKPKDYARQAFDTALHGLLIRENLEGAKWAIQQILDEAKGLEGGPGLGDSAVAEYLRTLAEKISGGLDKRTAELATREH